MITSEDVREELARIAPSRACDQRAELSALFHSAGSLLLRRGGDWALHLDLGSGAAARRAFALLRESGIRSEIRTYRRRAFDRATRYQLFVDGDAHALRVFGAAGVIDKRHAPLERPPRRVVGRACCRAAYLRGAFLGGGSLAVVRSPHLELRTASGRSLALFTAPLGIVVTEDIWIALNTGIALEHEVHPACFHMGGKAPGRRLGQVQHTVEYWLLLNAVLDRNAKVY